MTKETLLATWVESVLWILETIGFFSESTSINNIFPGYRLEEGKEPILFFLFAKKRQRFNSHVHTTKKRDGEKSRDIFFTALVCTISSGRG